MTGSRRSSGTVSPEPPGECGISSSLHAVLLLLLCTYKVASCCTDLGASSNWASSAASYRPEVKQGHSGNVSGSIAAQVDELWAAQSWQPPVIAA